MPVGEWRDLTAAELKEIDRMTEHSVKTYAPDEEGMDEQE
jgi:hypothetical protein